MQDPVEHQPIRNRTAPRIAEAARALRDQRLDLRPQRIINLESRRHLHDLQSSATQPTDSPSSQHNLFLKDLLRQRPGRDVAIRRRETPPDAAVVVESTIYCSRAVSAR
jgi:hypothetical protein